MQHAGKKTTKKTYEKDLKGHSVFLKPDNDS